MTRQNNITSPMEYGKIPPQAVEIEGSLLGAMLIEPSCIDNILAILSPSSFYMDEHNKIFSAIIILKSKSRPVDLLTVTNELRSMKLLDEVGGPVYVTQLTSNVASSAHAEYHAKIIQQCFIKRELIRFCSETQSQAFDESVDLEDLLNGASLSLNKLSNETVVESSEILCELLKQRMIEIENIATHPEKLTGVPSGLTNIDRMTGGWQKTDLIIIAARPSMGKTSLSFNQFAIQAAIAGIPTVFFSIEMSKTQLTDKAISSQAKIAPNSLRMGRVKDHEWEIIDHKTKKLYEIPLYIDDTPAISLLQLRSKVAKLLRKNKLGLVMIDYLQLMNNKQKGSNREQEISDISRGLKQLAKEINIPIIALSQLNRSVEIRGGAKRPQLSDLRESGAIEQDADLVIFIHRPEKYGIMEYEDGSSTRGVIELILAKHRNGATDTVLIHTNEYCSQFKDYVEALPQRQTSHRDRQMAKEKDDEVNDIPNIQPDLPF